MKPYYKDNYTTIYHGDCRDIMQNCRGGCVVSDPPYNVGYHYEGYSDDLDAEEYQELLRNVLYTPSVVIHYAEDICKLSWTLEEIPKKIVAWVYPSNTRRQWRSIAWFGIKPDFTLERQPYKNPTDKRIAERIANGQSARLYDWWEIDQIKNVGNEKTEHPCQIPLKVLDRILKITPAEFYVDPFMGSGTTLRAAKDLGRKAIGIEINERYCEIAAKRLSQEVLNLTDPLLAVK
jgi:DNA modification methylase